MYILENGKEGSMGQQRSSLPMFVRSDREINIRSKRRRYRLNLRPIRNVHILVQMPV